jgi:hypothetical protein
MKVIGLEVNSQSQVVKESAIVLRFYSSDIKEITFFFIVYKHIIMKLAYHMKSSLLFEIY